MWPLVPGKWSPEDQAQSNEYTNRPGDNQNPQHVLELVVDFFRVPSMLVLFVLPARIHDGSGHIVEYKGPEAVAS